MNRSIAIAALVALAGEAAAQDCGSSKIISAQTFSQDILGFCVDISGGVMLVGSPIGDTPAGDSGKVTAYVRSAATWTQTTSLIPSDQVTGMKFGHSVALVGDRAIVGSPARDSSKGAVYFFQRNGSTWTQKSMGLHESPASPDNFGSSVAMSSDARYAAVGAIYDDVDGKSDSGSAAVFKRNADGTWTRMQMVTPPLAQRQVNGHFGQCVAIDNDVLAVGAPGDAEFGQNASGHVHIFRLVGGVWTYSDTLGMDIAEFGAHFGQDIALSGPRLVVGAPGCDDGLENAGKVFHFTDSGQNFQWQSTYFGSLEYGAFGASVDIDGPIFVASIPGTDELNDLSLRYVYVDNLDVRGGGGMTMADADAIAAGRFGSDVAISGPSILVGDSLDDHSGKTNNGAAYLYTWGGDDCDDAIAVPAGSYTGCTEGYTSQLDQNPCGSALPPGGDLWFAYTALCAETITIDTNGSSFDTVLSVHTDCPGELFAFTVACDDDTGEGLNSQLSFTPSVGYTYLIRVSGHNGQVGEFTLNIDACTEPCPADFSLNGVLNVFDFLDFQTAFSEGDMRADMNGDLTLNVFDFLDFQTAFSNGC